MKNLHPKLQSGLIVALSCSLTAVTLLLLGQAGRVSLFTEYVDVVHKEYPSTIGSNCHCPKPKECITPGPSRQLHPKKFQEVPSLRFQGTDTEAAKSIDWESQLLTANGGFLMVEEWDYKVKGYGVSMFHQLHCLTMM
jgi:hypothetical protein